jgi:transposase
MELKLLTELLNLPDVIVKKIIIKEQKFFLTIEQAGYPVCPKCGQQYLEAPKDSRSQIVEDLSAFEKRCFLEITKYRIECDCGYHGTEEIEWLDRYERDTVRYQKRIYAFCKRMTCIDVARVFGISKHTVYRIDKDGITKELKEQKPVKPKRISIDEISRKKGHRYATIISAPLEKKILEVIKDRKAAGISRFFKEKGDKWCKNIEAASMDAWKAFRKAVVKNCINAVICFDHFHLAQHFSKSIDKLRVRESRNADSKDKEIYRGTRWLLLKHPEKLKEDQRAKLDMLLEINKNLYKAYILRDEFRQIFGGDTPRSRLIRLSNWIRNAKAARIPELSKFVKQIENWKPFIKNSLRMNFSNSFAEGLNNKVRVIQRMAYGYKDFDYLRLKIIQQFNFREIKSIFDD